MTYPYDNPFARRLRELRRVSGWTQAESAKHIGVSRAYLSGLEGGSQTTRNTVTLHNIARTYSADVDELISLTPPANVRTVHDRVQRVVQGVATARDDRAALDTYLDPEIASYYKHAAEALVRHPDEVYAAFDLIPPDMVVWLRGNADHIAQVRRVMDTKNT